MKAGSTAITQRPRDRVPSGIMLALQDPRRLDRVDLAYFDLKIFSSNSDLRGSLDKFPDFFRMDTFIDSTHMKLYSPLK